MKNIIVTISDFDLKQSIKVYDEKNQIIYETSAKTEEIESNCVNLCSKYNITEIFIKGSKKILAPKLKKNIETQTKYAQNKIKVTIC